MTATKRLDLSSSRINPPVFFGAAGLILAFVLLALMAPRTAESLFEWLQAAIVDSFGWFYLLAVAIFLVFSIGLAASSYGNIRLGPEHSQPDFGYLSWFAMLFSAGMGIGLLFFGVAEPIMHFTNPPSGEAGSVEAARQAMEITFFHWGVHAWAIYAVVGLSLAYFGFRHRLPLTVRSALYPLIGDRIHGPIGHAVDIFAVLGTMFGVATSLGFGVMQVNTGLNYLFGLPDTLGVQVGLIAVITAFATMSVVAGLHAGIKRLSELNLILAITLLVFLLLVGPTGLLLQMVVQNTGNYLSHLVARTFELYAYEQQDWVGGWTLFYWGWWISWSPFVGMFIARVSRGRTIREFIIGVLAVPVGFTILWMTFFGNTAISVDMNSGSSVIAAAVNEDTSIAIFALLENLPLTALASGIATLLVVTFFVTSSDSGSLVIDIITSGGAHEPPVWQRVFWAVTEGVVAAALLIAGGLTALQTASIASALPFAAVLLVVAWGLLKGLRMEGLKRTASAIPPAIRLKGSRVTWQERLKSMLTHPAKPQATRFLHDVAKPALEAVAAEIRNHESGMQAEVRETEKSVEISVSHGHATEFLYGVYLVAQTTPTFAFPEFEPGPDREHRYYRAEVYLLEGSQHYDIYGYTQDQVIADVLSQYEKHMHFLHLSNDH